MPYNQSREMAAALRAAGVRYEFYSVSRRDAETERDTTITGTVLGPVDGDYVSPLAGHASEQSTTHIVMTQALGRLASLYEGDLPAERCVAEHHVDGGGVTSAGASSCPL